MYREIHHFKTDIQYFGHEIGLVEASSGVDDPPPEGYIFMSLDEFLLGEWMITSGNTPDLSLGGQDNEDPIINEPHLFDSATDTHDRIEIFSSLEE